MTLCAAALALVLSASALAQDYPNKQVQFITQPPPATVRTW